LAKRESSEALETTPGIRAAEELDEALGLAIRARRWAVNMTQQELATCCGISFQQIQKYENGTNRISFSRLAQIANALDTTVVDFACALQPAQARAPLLGELRMLAMPGALALLEEYAALSGDSQRLLLAFLRQIRSGVAGGTE
jgi:transcriptional regulator with XRE-family HTH domain